MTATRSRYTRILVGANGAGGAWDFSGVSNALDVDVSVDRLDSTAFQESAATSIAGDPKGSIKQQGYYDNTGAGTEETEIAESILNAELLYVAALFGTDTSACICYVSPQTNTENMTISTPVANLMTLNGSWGGGTGLQRGVRLYTGTLAATGAQTYIDLAGPGSAGGNAWLFVTAISGTATSATCTVQCDDNTGFTSATTLGTFTFSATGAYPIALGTTVDRYIRLNCTSKGGATSFAVTAIVSVSGVHYSVV